MSKPKIVFQNWIVELGRDPSSPIVQTESPGQFADQPSGLSQEIEAEVKAAFEKLTENEQEFIRQFHFMGRSYQEIADQSGRKIYRLEALHKRAIRKLRKELVKFVKIRFGVVEDKKTNKKGTRSCTICDSPSRVEIDLLISQRDKKETWSPVIKEIRLKFGVKVKSPQAIIGHEKYHQ